jgi:CheY-like chemotaxis protein
LKQTLKSRTRSAVVADDDGQVRYFVRLVLAHAGYSVREAVNGKDALEKLATQPADLLVTDLMMPDVDGIELIRSVRASGPPITIIAMSGADESVYLRVASRLGADYVLRKPFTIEDLQRVLSGIMTVEASHLPEANQN